MDISIDSSKHSQLPQAAIGFIAVHQGTPDELDHIHSALQRALGHFNGLVQKSFNIGKTQLVMWGRGDVERCSYIMADGSILVLVGSPNGNYSWETISENVLQASNENPFMLPWDGRVILLRIDPTGNIWTLWNDWLGSMPIFYANTSSGRVVSTLEPAVVDVLGVGEGDLFLPGLLALLMWGHYFSDWTLFKSIKVVSPDSESRWDANGFQTSTRFSILPNEDYWQAGWDEIMEEMYVLSKEAIASVLKKQPRWILPLSSGLDSRLIAGVAAELGTDIVAYTWGTPKSSDVIHAKSVAGLLGIPWKYLQPGDTYLTSYREQWADLFGSAMHFHGMYQMPFLDALKHEQPGYTPIISGFIGECLTGYDVKFLCEIRQGKHPYQITPDGYMHWTLKELRELMNITIDDAISELKEEYEHMLDLVPGPIYQKLRFLSIWGRQRHFTYFQSMMSDYWRGVATPYINRKYAQLTFSLPRAVLDERLMQRAMFARYYPKLSSTPGTYDFQPITLSGSYLLKKRIAHYLPRKFSSAIFPGLYRMVSASEIDCVRRDGKDAFYPIFADITQLTNLMNIDVVENTYEKIQQEHNIQDVRKLQSIQTLAYRLSNH